MPLMSVSQVRVRPEKARHYEKLIRQVAKQARQKSESWFWEAHQTRFGQGGTFHYVTACNNYGELAEFADTDRLVLRVCGAKEGERILEEVGLCVQEQRREISIDRPDLSYMPEDPGKIAAAAVLTEIRARPGHQEAAEELIRKVAEAIPKVGDSQRILTFQTMFGNMSEYTTVRPLEELGDFDQQRPAQELLTQAFGPAEGGLIYRSGLDAIEHVARSVLVYREDLSNPRTD